MVPWDANLMNNDTSLVSSRGNCEMWGERGVVLILDVLCVCVCVLFWPCGPLVLLRPAQGRAILQCQLNAVGDPIKGGAKTKPFL